MNKTIARANPSMSLKRKEENDKNTSQEINIPKKKRESAIRSEHNLKKLIQNGQIMSHKQKLSPKKVLSSRKDALTETLTTLINAGNFHTIDKLYSKSIAPTLGYTENADQTPTEVSDSDNEFETLPTRNNNRLESVPKNIPNPIIITKPAARSTIPLRETVDADSTNIIISSADSQNQHKVTKPNSNESQRLLNADLSALDNLIRNLAPSNKTENHRIEDIEHVEKIYNTILQIKSKLNAVYQEKSLALKKAFESVRLFVPELKKDLILPTLEQLRENSKITSEESRTSRQEQPSCLEEPASHLEKPSPRKLKPPSQPVEPSKCPETSTSSSEFSTSSPETSNSSPQSSKSSPETSTYSPESSTSSPEPSTSSKYDMVVAKWTLKHQGPGLGLVELMPNAGIYVSETEFTRCKLLASDMRKLGRLLLPLVFKREALYKCSYTGYGRNGKPTKSKNVSPGLDEHARNTLTKYVTKYAKQSGWTIISPSVLNRSLRAKLSIQYRSSRLRFNPQT